MSSHACGSPDSAYWLGLADRPVFDWAELAARLPFATGMAACIQDPIHHAEGDVWTHTRMVVEALIARRSELGLAPDRWPGLLLAALLHDIAKPATRTESIDEDGRTRVHHHGHAKRGAQMAWAFLWREGVPLPIREQVHHLIAWHQRPFHLGLSRQLEPRAIAFSQIGIWRELIAHADADRRGRISADADETAMHLELLAEEIGSRDLLDRPWPFASDHARIWQGLKSGRSPHYDPPSPKGSHVIVLSGLPGAGKDTYCRSALAGWPQVSLDVLRDELDVTPSAPQGRVVQQATEAARRHLRAKERFVWNATSISRTMRDRIIGLAFDYDAFVEIHAFDTPLERLFEQNRSREHVVPEAVIEKLIRKWEPPSVLEAHRVVWVER